MGGESPLKMLPLLEKCVGDSLKILDIVKKNLGPSQKIIRPAWCPKLVTGLGVAPFCFVFSTIICIIYKFFST